jgi:Ca-activated chloride channel homolog
VSFGSPYLLLLLLLVPVVAVAAVKLDRRRSRYAVAFTNLELLAAIAPARRPFRRWLPLVLFLLALATAAAAVARPRASVSRPADQATVVLLVDVSGSMRAADVKPTRLGAAQQAMEQFVSTVPKAVRIGLVSFSSGPNELVIPTTDRSILGEGIDLLSPEAGTAIGDGLALAVNVAKQAVGSAPRGKDGKRPAAIILLSDGAQTRGTLQPLQGADLARNAGIRVFTVALGTNHGTLGVTPFGNLGGFGRRFNVRPDPVTLAAIARDTGGKTYQAATARKVSEVYKELGSSIISRHATREVSSWFTGLAALLLLGSLGAARITGERLP